MLVNKTEEKQLIQSAAWHMAPLFDSLSLSLSLSLSFYLQSSNSYATESHL
jgi:hypothetical protein